MARRANWFIGAAGKLLMLSLRLTLQKILEKRSFYGKVDVKEEWCS